MDPALKICKPSLVTAFNDNAIWGDPRARAANCYAYALNCPAMGPAVPGQLTVAQPHMSPETVTVDNFHGFLTQKDKLVEISREDALSGKFHAIALRIDYQRDCHFYRRDPIGIWSYKNGDQEISRFDGQGSLIEDPREIKDRHYTQFGGYYAIPEGGILYLPAPAYRGA